MYLTRYERWTSPLFLAGESYGTTRASALSGYLIGRGIAFNGIVLISTIMNFETADFAPGNDLPYVMFLPSYAATAWYHKKLRLPICNRNQCSRSFRRSSNGPPTITRWRWGKAIG